MQITQREYEGLQEELELTLHRLRWFVSFAFADFGRLSLGEKADYELGLLSLVPESAVWVPSGTDRFATAWSEEDALALQGRLQPILESIADGKPTPLPFPPLHMTWLPPEPYPLGFPPNPETQAKEWPATVRVAFRDEADSLDVVTVGVYALAELLRALPGRIRRCPALRSQRMKHQRPTCGKVFVGRPEQRWCTPACAVRVSRAKPARRRRGGG